MILKHFAKAAVAVLALATTSCIQSDQKTSVNPDGSGKFNFTVSLDMAGLMEGLGGLGGGGADKLKDDPMQQMLKEMIGKSEGVDVWSEAKVEKGGDGKSKMVVAGYFKDIGKLKLAAGGKEQGVGDFGAVKSSKDADGNWVLDMSGDAAEAADEKPAADAKKMTDEEVKEKIEGMKMQMGMMKGLMEQMMGTAKIETTLTVAGTITDYGVFEKVDGNSGKIALKPAKMFSAMEAMLDDPIKGRALVEASEGGDPMKMMQGKGAKKFAKDIMQAMIGKEGAPRLVIKPGDALFDYAKESEAAKANQSAELKALLNGGGKSGEGKVKLPKAA